jgi:hypothetical protein
MSKTHVPAWKRIGLKLKYANESAATPKTGTKHTASPNGVTGHPNKKRRLDDEDKEAETSDEIIETSGTKSRSSSKKVKKQVSFTADTKTKDGDSAVSIIPSEEVEVMLQGPTKSKQKKQQTPKTNGNLPSTKPNDALEYLSLYYTANESWKFNKNRDIWIMKHALSNTDIPVTYNLMLAQYINGLKSTNTRSRLRDECLAKLAASDYEATQLADHLLKAGPMALAAFPDSFEGEGSALRKVASNTSRSRLLLFALDTMGSDAATLSKGHTATPRKRKNRTAVVEDSSSSSSSSESESEDDEDSSSESDEESSSSDSASTESG